MANPMTLEGSNILVTGAAQGIGRAVAEFAAEQGANLALVDVNADGINELAESLGSDRARAWAGSVAEPGFVQDTVEAAVSHFGALHGLLNNAGIIRTAMIHKMSFKQWQEVIDVNLTGAMLVGRESARHFVANGGGHIVNVGSTAARIGKGNTNIPNFKIVKWTDRPAALPFNDGLPEKPPYRDHQAPLADDGDPNDEIRL